MAMFENIGVFFKRFMQNDKKELLAENPLSQSKETAKDRLHVVLMQDRANVSADFLEMMKEEIIEVIKKYIVVDESKIDVRLTNEENEDGSIGAPLLHANIPILNIRNDLKGEYMYNHKSEENSEVKKEEKVVPENTQIVQVIKEQDLEENSVKENSVNVSNPKIIEIEEENNVDVNNPKIIENDEIPKNSDNERIKESVNEIQKDDIIHDTIEVNKVDEQVLEEQKNQDLQQENSEEQALELEEIENLDEEDDDVTFDDLLKAAEEEEERLKQLGQYDNKKENNDTEDENNQEETENIETKVEDNGENIDSKIEDNSKEVRKVKKISSNSKTTTKKTRKTTRTSSKTKNK